jgi:hypothetical protein
MPLSGYSATPLVQKLGIKPDARIALIGAPAGFRRELVGLPSGVALAARAQGSPDLVVWFVKSARQLHAGIAGMTRSMGAGLWIAWPKKSSALASDISETEVRAAGLANGLVDYKVCAINETWSGLKFARRPRVSFGSDRRKKEPRGR